MARHHDFLVQLENFRHEAYSAAQYLYADMAVQHAASKSTRLLARLNFTPLFWLTNSAASQVAAYVCLGRVFDKKSPYNIDALLNSFEASLALFSKSSLADRKRDGKATDPPWLAAYLAKAHYPDARDVARLRKKVSEYRDIYDRAIKPARHKYIAHREKQEQSEVQALFARGKIREIWRIVTFLYALYEALWQQYHNGRKAILRPMRYSVKTIYDSKMYSTAPHEAVIAQTKKLMQLLEAATPNPSVKGRPASGTPLKSNVGLLMRTDLLAREFDETISAREAYLAMEALVAAYLACGDGAVSEFLDFYIGTGPGGLATKSDAPAQYLAALATVRSSRA